MSDVVRMRVKGMTCAHCETTVATVLKDVGARDVDVDFRRAEATFKAPAGTDLAPYQEALSRAGYRAGSAEVVEGEASPRPVETSPVNMAPESRLGTLAMVALPVLCCGLPVLAAAASLGSAAWLAAHGLLLAMPVAVLATALLVRRRARRTT